MRFSLTSTIQLWGYPQFRTPPCRAIGIFCPSQGFREHLLKRALSPPIFLESSWFLLYFLTSHDKSAMAMISHAGTSCCGFKLSFQIRGQGWSRYSKCAPGIKRQVCWQINDWLVVGPPLWKIWKSVGMMTFPIYGKIKNGNQTTNQINGYKWRFVAGKVICKLEMQTSMPRTSEWYMPCHACKFRASFSVKTCRSINMSKVFQTEIIYCYIDCSFAIPKNIYQLVPLVGFSRAIHHTFS